jgi:hypothetical protein
MNGLAGSFGAEDRRGRRNPTGMISIGRQVQAFFFL